MKRSISVTISAILALIGSILCAGSGALGALAIFLERGRLSEGQAATATALFGMLVIILPGIWGIATGIGILLLKGWARISMIIFASLFGSFCFGRAHDAADPHPDHSGRGCECYDGHTHRLGGLLSLSGRDWNLVAGSVHATVGQASVLGRSSANRRRWPALEDFAHCMAVASEHGMHAFRSDCRTIYDFLGLRGVRLGSTARLRRLFDRLPVSGGRAAAA